MNRGQTRNGITIARQLARFRNKRMSYKNLQHVINLNTPQR
ncbi:AAA family ATPase [Colletotrichum graminicola]|nr:AAA family ATPase [Colletotrichum graminicola]